MWRIRRFFHRALLCFHDEETWFKALIDLARWSEGGLPIRDLKAMPIDELIWASEKAAAINAKIKKESTS